MPQCESYPPLAPSTRTLHSHPPLVDRAQLVRAGHEVRLYIHPEYLSLVPTVAGLSVIGSQQTTAATMERMAPAISTGKHARVVIQALVETQMEFFGREADSLKAVCAGWAEIVIFNAVAGHVGFAVTEALSIKALLADVVPLLPTRELFPLRGSLKLPKCMYMFCWWLLYARIGLPAAMKRTLETWKAANGTQARF